MAEQTNGDTLSRRLSAHLDRTVVDPTVLTTQQLQREVSVLREILEARFDGQETVVKLLQLANDRIPEAIEKAVNRLQELHEEKFDSVQTQFKERDVRAEQAQIGSKTAVDTAFVAQKEAVGAALQAAKEAVSEQNKSNTQAILKSEASTTKQIDGINEKIADVKGRLDRGEGNTSGVKNTQDDNKAWIAIVISLVATIVTVIIGIAHLIK